VSPCPESAAVRSRFAEAVAAVAGRALLESSGRLTLATARAYAETGVNFLSVGSLTHSAPILDIGLDLRAEAPDEGDAS